MTSNEPAGAEPRPVAPAGPGADVGVPIGEAPEPEGARHWPRRLVRVALFAVAAWFLVRFARSVHWGETWRALRGASLPLLLAATALNFASLLVRGTRWALFLRGAGVRDVRLGVRGAVVGSGLNNVLPANGGEAARVLLVARRSGAATARVAATVALDRVVDLLVFLGVLALAPHVVPLPGMLRQWGRIAGIAFVAAMAIALPLLVRARRRRRTGVAAPEALPEGAPWTARVKSQLAHFADALAQTVTGRRLAPALVLSLVSWALQLATYHVTARAAGLAATPVASGAAMLAVNMTFFVQLTPGNVGVFQLVYALVMAAFGLPRARAIAVALMVQALQIIPVTVAALALAPPWALRRRADRRTGAGG